MRPVRPDLRDPYEQLRHNRAFVALTAARSISIGGSAVTTVALAYAIVELTGSVSMLSAVLAARALALIAGLLIGGVIADRFPRTRVMRASNAASGLTQGALALAILTHPHGAIGAVFLLAAGSGFSQAMFLPASAGVIPTLVSPSQLVRANGVLQTSLNAGNVLGAACGGLVVAALSPAAAIGLDAFSFAIGALLLSRIKVTATFEIGPKHPLRQLRDGWSLFRRLPWAWVTTAEFAVINACYDALTNLLGPLATRHQFASGAAHWGGLVTASALGLIVGGLVASRLQVRKSLLLANIAITGVVPVTACLAVSAPYAIELFAAVLAGISIAIFAVLWGATLQDLIPQSHLSRIASFDQFGSYAVGPVGLALCGPLLDHFGIRSVLIGSSALTAGAIAAGLSAPALRKGADEMRGDAFREASSIQLR